MVLAVALMVVGAIGVVVMDRSPTHAPDRNNICKLANAALGPSWGNANFDCAVTKSAVAVDRS